MYDTSPGSQTALQYSMATQTAHTPSATSPYHISMPRPTRAMKSTTPATSPRAAFSVGQAYAPNLTSPKHISEERVPSPNYFGLVLEPSEDAHDSSMPSKGHWSPASSSIKSFTAALPKPVTLDPNPEFEAFKRQVDRHRGLAEAVPTSPLRQPPSQPGPKRPRPSRWHTHDAAEAPPRPSDPHSFRLALNKTRALLQAEKVLEGGQDDEKKEKKDTHIPSPKADVESKRNSDSMLQANLTPIPPMLSPGLMDVSPSHSQQLFQAHGYDSRLSLFDNRTPAPSFRLHDVARATTLPTKIDQSQQGMITAAQLADVMTSVPEDKRMIIDIRSMQNFSQSRIKDALNICIPTTLLKRATFNIEKLQQTFQGRPEADKFAQWDQAQWIIVYDSHTTDGREAITAQNMMKKFTAAGFQGQTGILRGGFNQFRGSFPDLVDSKSSAGRASKPSGLSLSGGCGGLAPVIGGVSLPAAGNHNAFFSNIRQNVDLADGVGQFEVARPEGVDPQNLPQWLQSATSPTNQGKEVSDKFLNIELDEQKRMRSCYAAFNPQHDQSGAQIQLCGVEKGVKNRYKDILPFEHARVHLQNKPEGCCDYVNASHLATAGSNKKYIATQGPLPATFEDFWSMVWEQDVRVIVMLTATTEGGQLKCHPYWEGREFGPVKLRPLSEKKASLDMDRHRSDSTATPPNPTNDPGRRRANTTTTFETPTAAQTAAESTHVVIRKFAMSHADHPFAPIREITHLHFPGWPDFGTPTRPSHLLALVELANVMQRAAMPVETGSIVESRKVPGEALPTAWYDAPEAEDSRPMLVHCSAGCGRTGAFCTVDTVIDMLKRRRQVSNNANTTDGEGDVSMTDVTDAVLPMTKAANADNGSYFQQSFQSLGSAVKMQSQAGLDKTWISDESVDLVQKTVKGFREQRLSMVQSLRQYVLCYETILEWAHRTREKDSPTPTGSQQRKRSGSLTLEL